MLDDRLTHHAPRGELPAPVGGPVGLQVRQPVFVCFGTYSIQGGESQWCMHIRMLFIFVSTFVPPLLPPCLDERLGQVALRLQEPSLPLRRMHHALKPRDEQHDRHPRRPLLGHHLLLPGGLGGTVRCVVCIYYYGDGTRSAYCTMADRWMGQTQSGREYVSIHARIGGRRPVVRHCDGCDRGDMTLS